MNSMKETRESEDLARFGLLLSTGGILYPSLYRELLTRSRALSEWTSTLRAHVFRRFPRTVLASRRSREWLESAATNRSAVRTERQQRDAGSGRTLGDHGLG